MRFCQNITFQILQKNNRFTEFQVEIKLLKIET